MTTPSTPVKGTVRLSTATVPALSICDAIQNSYHTTTPKKAKVIDVYLLFTVLSGILVFVYGVLTSAVPYHSFLAGFMSTIGSFALGFNLRCQIVDPSLNISAEKSLAQFLICHVFLFTGIANFIA